MRIGLDSFSRQLTPRTTLVTMGVVLALVIGAFAAAWRIAARREPIAEVPGLGRFVIRDPGDVIQRFLLLGQPWEPGAIPVFEKYIVSGASVADIGAYNGVHSIRFAHLVGPTGHVYSFEPNPASFDMLTENVRLNDVGDRLVAYPYGVSDVASTDRIMSRNPRNLGGTKLCSQEDVRTHQRGCEAASDQQSRMVRIDDDIARWFPTRVSFLKIDVEGYEDRVLAGSKAWIKRDRPVIWIEIWDDAKRQREHMHKAQEPIALIESLGYKLEHFYEPWDYLFVPVPEPAGGAPPAASK